MQQDNKRCGGVPVQTGSTDAQLPGSVNLDRLRAVLSLLAEARDDASNSARPVWDFSVEMGALERAGATHADLRWLLCKGYVEHAAEVYPLREAGRTFRRVGQLTFSAQSAFILTALGASFAREMAARPMRSSPHIEPAAGNADRGLTLHVPRWDRFRRELTLGGALVKRFKLPSANQEAVLEAFEEEHWPCRLDDPLPQRGDVDAKERLHDTIKNLNRRQITPVIRFMGDGSGEGVRWEAIVAAEVIKVVS